FPSANAACTRSTGREKNSRSAFQKPIRSTIAEGDRVRSAGAASGALFNRKRRANGNRSRRASVARELRAHEIASDRIHFHKRVGYRKRAARGTGKLAARYGALSGAARSRGSYAARGGQTLLAVNGTGLNCLSHKSHSSHARFAPPGQLIR